MSSDWQYGLSLPNLLVAAPNEMSKKGQQLLNFSAGAYDLRPSAKLVSADSLLFCTMSFSDEVDELHII